MSADSLPASDHFFRYLYALGTVGDLRLKRVWVFDPDREVGWRFNSHSAKPMSAGPRLLSIKDVAVYLGARVWAIRQMLRKRELPYVPVGGRFKIDKVELDRWIERQKIGTGVPA